MIKRLFYLIFATVFTIIIYKIGDIVLRFTNEEYAAKKKIETWNSRIEEFQMQNLAVENDSIHLEKSKSIILEENQ